MIDFDRLTTDLNVSQKDLSNDFGVSPQAITKVKKGDMDMPKSWISILESKYNVDIREYYIEITKPKLKTIDHDPNGKKIPFAGDVYATISEAMTDVVAYGPQTFINIPIFSQGEFALQASGRSMKGLINHGDWIVVKKIQNRNAIIYGECYVIVTKGDNLKTVKFIKEHADENKLWLIPYNIDQFDKQSIFKEDVLEIYSVVGLFRKV